MRCRAVLLSILCSGLTAHLSSSGLSAAAIPSIETSLSMGSLSAIRHHATAAAQATVEQTATAPKDTEAESIAQAIGELAQAPSSELATATWTTFTSEVGAFQFSMPSSPAIYTFSPELNVTNSLMYMQMQLVDANRLEIYAAAFIEAVDFGDHADTEATLLSCVTSLSNQALQSAPERIALGDYPGLEAEFRDGEGLLQISRCYLAGDRTYLLTASSESFNAGAGLIPQNSLVEPMRASEASEREDTEPERETPETAINRAVTRSQTIDAFFNSFEILD